MSKKKMYRLLAFVLITFSLLAVVLCYEIKIYSWGREGRNNSIEGDVASVSGQAGNVTAAPDKVKDNEKGTEEPAPSATPAPADTEEEKDINLFFAGDIYLSDAVAGIYKKQGIEGIVDNKLLAAMKDADIAMVNQEFTFSNRGKAAEDKQYTFRVNPDYVTAFQDMGIDIVTLANNHSMDFGTTALKDSFSTLSAAGISYVGAGNNLSEARNIHYAKEHGKTLAFLAASRVIPVPEWNATGSKAGMLTTYDPAFLLEDIKTAKENSDYVIVYLHWGIERDEKPKDYQRNLARQYIDAGADMVIGSHPHVLQGVEYYNGKPIIYSLGNYIFYSNIKSTAVLKVTLDEKLDAKIQLLPAYAANGKTQLIDNPEKIREFYEYMKSISFDVSFEESGYVMARQ
ncbi:CapA family protein [Anaerocolumna xylanovorans]|uniref:Poly-gamma-glutamate synthesis protein (Capsule biosynthesis protein) n=1 Tax=Anaerocolumna xylanovorans DSM 12503 TaxID=1121345 RepID=A0A1M7YAZ3_9FIRM|nr:CapA family protein [Anaerocolumna xylanovorans]SHO49795.1 poly-gamma-glutamate synthesis protein (capsule biosynthesis protein) [Anaerocolumna xylanovorans DSM 12503]